MKNFAASLAVAAGVSFVSGCANPAADVPPAKVSDPKVAPIPPATPGTEVPPAPEAKKASMSAPSAPSGATLAITPANSKIEFIGSKVTGSHTGGFKAFAGTYEPAGDTVEAGRIKAEIDMDSTHSDNEKLTGHLKSADFFDVAKFPKATFETTEIKPGTDQPKAKDATHTVTGNLTLHGVTKSIQFPAKLTIAPKEALLESSFSLNRKDFGIVYPGMANDLIRDEVVIKLSLKAPRSS